MGQCASSDEKHPISRKENKKDKRHHKKKRPRKNGTAASQGSSSRRGGNTTTSISTTHTCSLNGHGTTSRGVHSSTASASTTTTTASASSLRRRSNSERAGAVFVVEHRQHKQEDDTGERETTEGHQHDHSNQRRSHRKRRSSKDKPSEGGEELRQRRHSNHAGSAGSSSDSDAKNPLEIPSSSRVDRHHRHGPPHASATRSGKQHKQQQQQQRDVVRDEESDPSTAPMVAKTTSTNTSDAVAGVLRESAENRKSGHHAVVVTATTMPTNNNNHTTTHHGHGVDNIRKSHHHEEKTRKGVMGLSFVDDSAVTDAPTSVLLSSGERPDDMPPSPYPNLPVEPQAAFRCQVEEPHLQPTSKPSREEHRSSPTNGSGVVAGEKRVVSKNNLRLVSMTNPTILKKKPQQPGKMLPISIKERDTGPLSKGRLGRIRRWMDQAIEHMGMSGSGKLSDPHLLTLVPKGSPFQRIAPFSLESRGDSDSEFGSGSLANSKMRPMLVSDSERRSETNTNTNTNTGSIMVSHSSACQQQQQQQQPLPPRSPLLATVPAVIASTPNPREWNSRRRSYHRSRASPAAAAAAATATTTTADDNKHNQNGNNKEEEIFVLESSGSPKNASPSRPGPIDVEGSAEGTPRRHHRHGKGETPLSATNGHQTPKSGTKGEGKFDEEEGKGGPLPRERGVNTRPERGTTPSALAPFCATKSAQELLIQDVLEGSGLTTLSSEVSPRHGTGAAALGGGDEGSSSAVLESDNNRGGRVPVHLHGLVVGEGRKGKGREEREREEERGQSMYPSLQDPGLTGNPRRLSHRHSSVTAGRQVPEDEGTTTPTEGEGKEQERDEKKDVWKSWRGKRSSLREHIEEQRRRSMRGT